MIIIGEGKELKKLIKICKILKIEKDVSFPGFQDNPFSFLVYSDIFVLSSYIEGFPNVLIEAMICGVPVISTSCDFGPEEIISNNSGLLIPVGDILKMAEAMKKIIKNKKLGKLLSRNAEARVKDFNLQRMVSNYEMVIDGLAKQ